MKTKPALLLATALAFATVITPASGQNKPPAAGPFAPAHPPAAPATPAPAGRPDPFVNPRPGTPPAPPQAKPVPAAASDPFASRDPSDPGPQGDQRVRVVTLTLLTFSLDQDHLATFMDLPGPGPQRYDQIRSWEKAGAAKLDNISSITTRSGQKAKVEAINEFIFTTEWDAPAGPQQAAMQTAQEIKIVGQTLETEPFIDEAGTTIDLGLAFENVRLAKWRQTGRRAVDDPRPIQATPEFEASRVNTNVSLPPGEWRFCGTFSQTPGAEMPRQTRVAFARATDERVPVPVVKAFGPQPVNLVLEYRFYSMERAVADGVLAGAEVTFASYDSVLKLAAGGKAKLERLTTSITRSGQRTKTEEYTEATYGTDWDRGWSESPQPAPVQPAKEPAKDAPKTETKTEVKPEPKPKLSSDFTGVLETSHEIKNAGLTLETAPTLGEDGATVDVVVAPTWIRQSGVCECPVPDQLVQPSPLFERRQLNTNVSTVLGRAVLVGTFSAPQGAGVGDGKDDGRTWLCFLRVTQQ